MSVLGKIVDYPSCYNPGLLVPIPRIGSRVDLIKSYGVQESELGNGFDQWTAFEFCWKLKSDHSSLRNWKVAVLNINVPANSVNIVESKSLKLYLHSVSHLEFCNSAEVVDLLKADLSMLVKAQVEITLLGPDSWSDIMPTESKGLELETGKGDAVVGDNLVFYSNQNPQTQPFNPFTGAKSILRSPFPNPFLLKMSRRFFPQS